MSQERFIRCKHCGLPHEADASVCPMTGQAITMEKPRRPLKPPPSEEDYAWSHTVDRGGARVQILDPEDLEAFVGRLIDGKYRVEALIGRGGMGAVYRAKNERIERAVALKVMYRGYEQGSVQSQRFLREARLAGSLGHPNIVEVFDLGYLEDGKPYQVMELLEGQTLARRVETEGALLESEVVAIAVQVLSALDAAHEGGVVHRDLKPENVFLTLRLGEPVAKLIDFGVSKATTEHSLTLTRTGMIVGTPYYLSPEQARGDSNVGPTIDMWGMGVLLYECVTGVLPFNAPSYEQLLRKILTTDPVPPSRFQPRVSPALERLILRALARDPADRPARAKDMLAELRAVTGRVDDDQRTDRYPAYEPDGPGDKTVREDGVTPRRERT